MGDAMKTVAKRSAIMLMVLLSSLPLAAAPWLGGYRLSFDGYSEQAALANDEHLGIHLWIAPLDVKVADPLVSVGVLLPSYGNSPGPVLEANLEIRLFDWIGHPLSPLFRRESSYRPTIAVSTLFPFSDPRDVTVVMTAHPLSFFFGEKTVSILAPRLLYEQRTERWSWAVRLVEISHALF